MGLAIRRIERKVRSVQPSIRSPEPRVSKQTCRSNELTHTSQRLHQLYWQYGQEAEHFQGCLPTLRSLTCEVSRESHSTQRADIAPESGLRYCQVET